VTPPDGPQRAEHYVNRRDTTWYRNPNGLKTEVLLIKLPATGMIH